MHQVMGITEIGQGKYTLRLIKINFIQ